MMRWSVLLTAILTVSMAAADELPPLANEPAEREYGTQQVEGWTVHVNTRLLEGGDAADQGGRALTLLRTRLFDVKHVLPERIAVRLQEVPIWMEVENDKQGPGACYHPSRTWLVEHGFNPEKAKCVEICNAVHFVEWSHDQPAMLLHELAHAWHDQVLDFDESRIRAAYEEAKAGGTYEQVLHINGQTRRHYALENPKEYFAESTEAFLGTNDFFPFVRAELQTHDPVMYRLLEEIWRAEPETVP